MKNLNTFFNVLAKEADEIITYISDLRKFLIDETGGVTEEGGYKGASDGQKKCHGGGVEQPIVPNPIWASRKTASS